MASLNKVFLMGNLTRDPELRYTPGGNSAVCEFGLAINRRFMQAGGQEKDETCFLDIVVWGKQAESCSRFLQKGASVFVEGRLVYDQWTEKDTQKKRSRIRVTAERVQFLNGRRDDASGEPGYPEEEDPSGASYGSSGPRQNYTQRPPQRPAAQGGQPYARQQYGAQQQRPSAPPPGGQRNPPPMDPPPAGPEEDPFENVDDIPF